MRGVAAGVARFVVDVERARAERLRVIGSRVAAAQRGEQLVLWNAAGQAPWWIVDPRSWYGAPRPQRQLFWCWPPEAEVIEPWPAAAQNLLYATQWVEYAEGRTGGPPRPADIPLLALLYSELYWRHDDLDSESAEHGPVVPLPTRDVRHFLNEGRPLSGSFHRLLDASLLRLSAFRVITVLDDPLASGREPRPLWLVRLERRYVAAARHGVDRRVRIEPFAARMVLRHQVTRFEVERLLSLRRSALAMRLYAWVKTTEGRRSGNVYEWRVGLEKLRQRLGSREKRRHDLAYELRRAIELIHRHCGDEMVLDLVEGRHELVLAFTKPAPAHITVFPAAR